MKNLNLALPDDVHAAVSQLAAEDLRSVTKEIELAVRLLIAVRKYGGSVDHLLKALTTQGLLDLSQSPERP